MLIISVRIMHQLEKILPHVIYACEPRFGSFGAKNGWVIHNDLHTSEQALKLKSKLIRREPWSSGYG